MRDISDCHVHQNKIQSFSSEIIAATGIPSRPERDETGRNRDGQRQDDDSQNPFRTSRRPDRFKHESKPTLAQHELRTYF